MQVYADNGGTHDAHNEHFVIIYNIFQQHAAGFGTQRASAQLWKNIAQECTSGSFDGGVPSEWLDGSTPRDATTTTYAAGGDSYIAP